MVAVDDRVRGGVPQTVQLPRRYQEVAAAAGPPDEMSSSDTAELFPQALVGSRQLRRHLRGQLVPPGAYHGCFPVDRRLGDAQLFTGERQLLAL